MIIVTGGAGFIGSCVVRTLNDAGIEDIIIVDNIAETDKWMNMRNKHYINYIHKSMFLEGDGMLGFDDQMNIDELRPLNGYGYSKQLFDQWVKHQARSFPRQHVGLKFFNVYGPNEYFKGPMASMVFHGFNQIKEKGEIRLFKSCNPDFEDGGQLRDFVYVKDICSVILWMLKHQSISGLFNVGTGRAQSFRELAEATFHALDMQPNIVYIDMPEKLRGKYQYYTQANMEHLRGVGYDKPFFDVESGVKDYVQNHLNKDYLTF